MQNEIAIESFNNGFNCAQSVVAAFAPEFGISRELSLKLATGLGAGVNYQGNTCGAVTGAYIILGLRFGVDKPHDTKAKNKYRELADRFTEEFLKHYDSVNCRNLLQADVSDPAALQKLREANVFNDFCPKLVKRASLILEQMLKEKID